jgi:hypothetical protein
MPARRLDRLPVAGDSRRGILRQRACTASVAPTRQRRLKFFLAYRLDEAAHLHAKLHLDRIKPIVEKTFVSHTATAVMVRFSCRNLQGGSKNIHFWCDDWRSMSRLETRTEKAIFAHGGCGFDGMA